MQDSTDGGCGRGGYDNTFEMNFRLIDPPRNIVGRGGLDKRYCSQRMALGWIFYPGHYPVALCIHWEVHLVRDVDRELLAARFFIPPL
jgi:hypothetical protein